MEGAGIIVIVFSVIAAAAIASCEGDGDDEESRPSTPQVTDVDPADRSSGAVVTTDVTATFDRAMDSATIDTDSFTVTGPSGELSGTVSYEAGSRTASFDPADDLDLDTAYTAELGAAIRDSTGESLGQALTWSFVTGSQLDRATVDADGAQGNGAGFRAAISADGRFVAFDSVANNLVSGDVNGLSDVFVKDMQNGDLVRASADEEGNGGNGQSIFADIDEDGSYVVFESDASNLVDGDSNAVRDVFLKDVETGEIERISETESGVAGNGNSLRADITADGRYVVFESNATNLVLDGLNGFSHIFRKDRNSGEVVLVSSAEDGIQGNGNSLAPSISDDGRFVAFSSGATNLVSGDTNSAIDVFVKDLDDGSIVRASTSAGGTQGDNNSQDPGISGNGDFVVFSSFAQNLLVSPVNETASQIYRKSLRDDSIALISASASGQAGNDNSANPSIDGTGSLIAFSSFATNLVGLTQVGTFSQAYVKALGSGEIVMLSVVSGTSVGNSDSVAAVISADGRYAAFESDASNLVGDDTNGVRDILRAFISPL